MRMSNEHYQALKAAIAPLGLLPEATLRNRWDALWASKFNVVPLYNAGLNDAHIDTALRQIIREIAAERDSVAAYVAEGLGENIDHA